MDQAGFVQAGIKVEREKEFAQLRDALLRILAGDAVDGFLRRVKRSGLRVRQFEAILAKGIPEAADAKLADSGTTARRLYESLTLSDQAQMREFYLTEVEKIAAPLRARYHTQFETF